MKNVFLVFMLLFVVKSSQQKFVIPDVTIQAIKPKGIVITLPDSDGIQYFGFNGNVNNPIRGKEAGSISKDVSRAVNGLWQIKDENVQLKVGDIVYYWVFVQHNRLGFDKQEQKFTVAALVDEGTPPDIPTGSTGTCTPSATRINNGKSVCGGTIIFEDDFNTVDEAKWEKQLYIADKPDYEFVTYEKQNIESSNGFLNLRADLRPNVENKAGLDFPNGCTGNICNRKIPGKLVPPIIAGQVKSKFSFKYGRVEIRAQLPKGDWIYPQIWLETKDKNPSQIYNSGRIWLAYSRGNADLVTKSQVQIGNTVLYAGPVLSDIEPERSAAARMFHIQGGNRWSDEVHTFTLTWTPDRMTAAVDGDQMNIDHNSFRAFDKELLVTLGIAAGGRSDFPDGSQSGSNVKPWKRSTVRDTTTFYEHRNEWMPTWQNSVSTLRVDSIKIFAL